MMVDAGHDATEEILKQLQLKVRKVYSQAAKEAQEKLDKYLSGFAKRDKVKKAMVASGELSVSEYNKWRYGQICIGKRWADLVDGLSVDMVNADRIAVGLVNERLPDVYALNANYGTYQIEHDLGINTSWTLYDRSTVERLLRDDPDLLPKPKVDIPKDYRWNRQYINNSVTQAILQGEDISQLAGRIFPEIMGKEQGDKDDRNVIRRNRQAAMRTARTAVTGAQNSGRIDSYRRADDMGIKGKKEWLSAHDGRTREAHLELDGQQVDIDEPFEVDGEELMYPGDPDGAPELVYNCRCTMIYVMDILERSKSERDRFIEQYDEDKSAHKMSFDEWMDARG